MSRTDCRNPSQRIRDTTGVGGWQSYPWENIARNGSTETLHEPRVPAPGVRIPAAQAIEALGSILPLGVRAPARLPPAAQPADPAIASSQGIRGGDPFMGHPGIRVVEVAEVGLGDPAPSSHHPEDLQVDVAPDHPDRVGVTDW